MRVRYRHRVRLTMPRAIACVMKHPTGRQTAFSIIAAAALALWTPVSAFAQGGWALQSTPSTAAPADLNGVSCVSPNYCEAVGYAGGAGLAEVWNGSTWTVQSTPGSNVELLGVSCVSASFCAAVGYNTSSFTAIALEWNGSTWTAQSAPGELLDSVSCLSPTDCEAVGEAKGTASIADGWNGFSWAVQSMASTYEVLTSVSCVTASNCMTVGYGALAGSYHWDGSTWNFEIFTQQQGEQTLPFSVSCGSATNCMAVGAIYTNGAANEEALAEVWNGSSWTVANGSSPNDQADFQGVSCVSASDCTAVGVYSTSEYGDFYTLGESWNGSGWTIQSTPDPSGAQLGAGLDGIWCPSATDCTAVGAWEGSSYSSAQGFAEQWTG